MTAEKIRLLHSVPRADLESVLREGLRASSAFDDLGLEMRRGVIYCWLRPGDDKMWGKNPDYAYLEITVDPSRCRVADMDFASIALMYLQGQNGKPKNPEAVALLAKLYAVTSVPLSEYREGILWTPEVLVKGKISPQDIGLPPKLTQEQIEQVRSSLIEAETDKFADDDAVNEIYDKYSTQDRKI
jgi:hypothetical protein